MLNESVRHRLESNEEHLERISGMLEDDDKSNLLRERINSLQSWNRKAGRLLPWLAKITAPRSRT